MMNDNIKKILTELEIFGQQNEGYFNIPSETGKFLNMLVRVSKAKNLLEIGTSNGYSTIWLAEATQHNNGKVTTIEIDKNKTESAINNFNKAKLENIRIIEGSGLIEIPKLKEKYDFLFLDAIKKDYINYTKLSLPKLTDNAIITADNAIIFKDKMNDFLEFISDDKKFESLILPLGTGLSLSYRLE